MKCSISLFILLTIIVIIIVQVIDDSIVIKVVISTLLKFFHSFNMGPTFRIFGRFSFLNKNSLDGLTFVCIPLFHRLLQDLEDVPELMILHVNNVLL